MYRLLLWLVSLSLLLFSAACGEDEVGGQSGDLCGDAECIECDESADCDEGTYCHDEGVCTAQVCEPDSRRCEDGTVTACAEDGSQWAATSECDSGVCADERSCGCGEDGDCGDDAGCVDNACVADSEIACSRGGTGCPDGEVCVESEVCDDDECQVLRSCQFDCDGEVCGFESEFCCTGDTPVCGPRGECAPECPDGGQLCGDDFDQCCGADQACIFGDCRDLGASCDNFSDCPIGQYCDQAFGACMPDEFPEDLVCEDDFDFADIEPGVLWRWEGVEIDGNDYRQVMMTPLVADMTGNGSPNVVVNAYHDGSAAYPVVIDGTTGETSHYYDLRHTDFGAQLALVDIAGGDLPEIVAIGNQGGGLGVIKGLDDCDDPQDDEDGCYLWWNDSDVDTEQGAPVVGDFNGDDNIEILLRDTIVDAATGDVIATLDAGGYDYPIAVDITGDGRLEILGAGCLYSLDQDRDLDELWCTDEGVASAGKRYAGAGDLTAENGRDGLPEIVIVGDSQIFVVAGDTGQVLTTFDVPGGGEGGSPIVADFDGDDSAEIGVAGSICYTVFDMECLVDDGESPTDDKPGCQRPDIEPCDNGHHCACPDFADDGGTGDGVLWSIYAQDQSSQRTGSSVFDFQGDGSNEVVYNDECLLMVLDGQDGSPYFIYGNTNRTSSEYPIVVDVNGDNRTNIVVSANNDQFSRDCQDPIDEQPERFPECHPDDPDAPIPTWCSEGSYGVVALQDPEDRWVRTRSVWNQFDYYIDNTTDDAALPDTPAMPWSTHNTFRANRQGEVPLNAPDVAVTSVQANAQACPVDIDFQITIENQGAAAIPAGLPITLYRIEGNADPTPVLTEVLDQPLSPGGVATLDMTYEINLNLLNIPLDFLIVANDDGTGQAPVRDCNPDTASSLLEDVTCEYDL